MAQHRAYPNLRAFMDATGQTQAQIAQAVHSNQPAISRVLAGKEPRLPLALALARYANIPLDSLVRRGKAA